MGSSAIVGRAMLAPRPEDHDVLTGLDPSLHTCWNHAKACRQGRMWLDYPRVRSE